MERWRKEAVLAGFPGLYLASVESFASDHGLAAKIPLDAAVEFAPDWSCLPAQVKPAFLKVPLVRKFGARSSWAKNKIFKYSELIETMRKKGGANYLRYPCVTPMWDNSARRKENATVFLDSTPELYGQWLREVISDFNPPSKEENFIFINAWNEWAEGNHLEPCQRWGRQYLEATRAALQGQ